MNPRCVVSSWPFLMLIYCWQQSSRFGSGLLLQLDGIPLHQCPTTGSGVLEAQDGAHSETLSPSSPCPLSERGVEVLSQQILFLSQQTLPVGFLCTRSDGLLQIPRHHRNQVTTRCLLHSALHRRASCRLQRRQISAKASVSTKAVTMATISDTSLKFQEIIKKSLLVRSGSPAVYHLTPKKEFIGTKLTVGEKDLKKTNRTVLLVGETGAGKSTLINALVNYTMGVKWEDNVWFQVVVEGGAEGGNQAQSQTSDVVVYQIFGFEDQTLPYSLTLIDTPGFGSTAGHEYDIIISQRLLDLFRSENGVHEISAVGLVLKSTENRLTERLSYILDSVMSLFGKGMEKNIIALITHSDGIDPGNALKALEEAKIKVAKDEEGETIYFLFNNRQTTERTRRNMAAMKSAWDMTTEQIRQFTEFLDDAEPQSVVTAVKVLNDRIRLTACIQNLQERVEFIELKQREIKETQEALDVHELELKNNKNFTVEVEESYKDKEDVSGGQWGLFFYEGATCCTVCEENCHYPGCTVAWYPKHCEVMKDGRCTSCSGKCPVSDHVKEEWRYVTKTRKVKKTLEDLKRKYENTKSGSESLLKELQMEMIKLKTDKDRWLDEAFQHVMSLEQIALNVDSLSTHVHLDVLIEKMKERGDREKVKKLEEIKRRMEKDAGKSQALRFVYSAARKGGKVWEAVKNFRLEPKVERPDALCFGVEAEES